jgi:hypothetical protein
MKEGRWRRDGDDDDDETRGYLRPSRRGLTGGVEQELEMMGNEK